MIRDTAARVVTARQVPRESLAEAVAEAWRIAADKQARSPSLRGYGVAVTRTDWTPEVRREVRDQATYKLDKAGRRRRIVPVPAIEKQWVEMVKRLKREATAARAMDNASRGSGQ